VDAALFLVEPRKGKGPLTLIRDFADCQLAIDQTRLEQILVNLFSNALDAMQGQQERVLALRGEAGDSHYEFHVRDNGRGLPPDTMPRLFEPFFTTKPAAQGGLGLGLTISASLAADAGGSLTARQPDGGGAEFVLALPLLPTETPPHD
jgi:two-component system sensor histidine kinase AauS